jgi:Ni/Fe-hydrogenase subunit HybB-like protein
VMLYLTVLALEFSPVVLERFRLEKPLKVIRSLTIPLVIAGFILNRLNVSVTGLEASSGTHYFPKWTEVSVTLPLVGAGFLCFALAVRYFGVFEPRRVDSVAQRRRAESAAPVSAI